jgi:group II intron reverse transcriptase/maturase
MPDAQKSEESVYTKLARLTKVVKERRKERLTSLAHFLTPELLTESFWELNRKSAPGVDGVTVQDYEQNLVERIESLHDRLRSRKYRSQPVLRKSIPKSDGRERQLGVPTTEDKVVQRAAVEILNRIWEPEFMEFSHGFRKERGAQQAQDELDKTLQFQPVNWILDVDIRGFFDNLRHDWMRRFLEHRIADKCLMSLIGKWMKADIVEEDGKHTVPKSGVPQGGVVSPILANIYLHYVFDLWAVWRMRKQMRGRFFPYRYADDIVVCFEYEEDAQLFLLELRKRLAEFGLELHPEKTQLIEFGRRTWWRWRNRDGSRPKGFTFLGLTYHCCSSRKGKYLVLRVTCTKSLHKFKRKISFTCRRYRHNFLLLYEKLCQMLKGHYGFFGVNGNSRKLSAVYYCAVCTWRKWLGRRGDKRYFSWDKFNDVLTRYPLPLPRLARSRLHRSWS